MFKKMKTATKPTPVIVREPQQAPSLGPSLFSSSSSSSSSSSDVESIWKAAVERYEELTGTGADNTNSQRDAEKRGYQSATLTELENEMSRAKSSFLSFRHPSGGKFNIDRIRRNINASLGPIKALGGIVAHATKAAFPPAEAIYAAFQYLIETANVVSADYDRIESFFENLQTELNSLKVLEDQIKQVPELEMALTEVFASVLVLCGICSQYIHKKRIGKAIQALASGQDKCLTAAQDEFHRQVQRVHNVVQNATLSRVIDLTSAHDVSSANISHEIAAGFNRVDSSIGTLIQSADLLMVKLDRLEVTNEREETLKWLSHISFHDKQQAVYKKHHRNTGQWLLSKPAFQEWLDGDVNSTLWCPGIPGAGKTVMLSTTVAYVNENTDRSRVAIAFIYCDYREPITEDDMLSVIARQLAEQCHPLPAEVKEFRERFLGNIMQPSNDDRISLIRSIAGLFEKIFVFIDALDECAEENRESFLYLAEELSPLVRFFITSRPHLELDSAFSALSRIDITANESDVRTYLEDRVTKHRGLSQLIKQSPSLKTQIIDTIHKKADGMFLLAYLHVSHIEKQRTPSNARRALETLPQGLYEVYRQAFKQIQQSGDFDRSLAIKVLSFIFCAKTTLRLDELLHALSVEPGDTDFIEDNCSSSHHISSVCKSLLWVDEATRTVGLVHYTLQEFFQKNPELLPHSPDTLLAEACLRYLSYDVFKTGPCLEGAILESRLQKYSFLQYASKHWGQHTRQGSTKELQALVLEFLLHEKQLASSTQVLYVTSTRTQGWHARFPRNFTAIHAAAYWGLSPVLGALLNETSVDSRDSSGATAVHYAAQNGNTEVILLFLEKGAATDERNEKGQTPLALAARSGHKAAVDALLSAGSNASVEDIEGWTPLHWAIIRSHNDVVKALLDSSSTDYSEEQLNKALVCAAEAGNEDAVETLIAKGANVDFQDETKSTPMDWAAPERREGVVRVLLKHGARLDLTDIYDNSCLHWAISHPRIARLLLQNGANVNARNRDNSSPLHWSVQEGQAEITEVLLEFGADVNCQDDLGVTALHSAALNGNEPIAKLLLEKGAKPHLKDVHGWTPLHAAAVNQHKDLVDLLVPKTDNGEALSKQIAEILADPNNRALVDQIAESKSRGSDVVSGLRNAADNGQVEKTLALLNNGADIDGLDPIGGTTALTIAAALSRTEVVQLLIHQGADINRRDRRGRVPLHFTHRSSDETVEILVMNGADVNLKIHNWTPLLLAAKYWRSWISGLLIHNGADVTAADYHGRTALHWLSSSGNENLVRLLVENGADVNARDRWGRTPLCWAVHDNRLSIVRLLLTLGADVTIATVDGYTPLHVAADARNLLAVKDLLESGADVRVRAHDGLTAYDIAALKAHTKIQEELAERGAKRSTVGDIRLHAVKYSRQTTLTNDDWYLNFDQDPVAMTLRERLAELVNENRSRIVEDFEEKPLATLTREMYLN